ncbi:MAG TPA: acetate uptake transporter [Streptosporangiaceae bacterium]|nr:acetate uptake transporter [Streptosporangiaceae bacterium]
MSTSEAPAAPATAPAVPATGIADPAPLGLAAFALTTFLLSVINAGWAKSSTGFDWWGYAIAYGGLCQLLAGMWEFRNRNVFGATAFSTYGGFWIGAGLWLHFIAPTATHPIQLNRDLGWILLAFAIFNTYMLIISTQLNMAVFLVFLTLELTEIFLFIGNFATKTAALPPFAAYNTTLIEIGGIIGVITALVAWYTSAAGVINGIKGKPVFPVGKPLFNLGG